MFTLLTIPIAHEFWNHQCSEAMMGFFFTVEHMALIGGLMLAAILWQQPRHARA
ncbi:MAG TPA: hypothetical protein VGC86_08270 [Afipia sp.]